MSLKALIAELDDRYLTLLANRARKVAHGDGLPLHLVVVEELGQWVTVLASYNRSLDWAGATPWHQSARVGATVRSPWVQTLRIDSGDPQRGILERLHRFQPQVLVGYASMLRLLASEQLAGRLTIAPDVIFSASEVLTGETRRRIHQAWSRRPFDVYAATGTAGIERIGLTGAAEGGEDVDQPGWSP
jgi:phenylacetate-coenzyme A ligase PaaK-like adenylate-forming protein